MKKDIDRGGDSSVEATAAKLLDVREPKYRSARDGLRLAAANP